MEENKFIGPNKIISVVEKDLKTTLGYDTVEVEYVDGSKHLMTKKYLEKMSTDEATDYTELRERMTKAIVGELLVVMAEWSPRYEDVNHIIDVLVASNNSNIEEATEFLYGVRNYERNMLHVKQVLDKKNENRKNNNPGVDSSNKE